MGLLRHDLVRAKRHAEVLGARMAYLEAGKGRPIVFLHGNPTSSFLWRKVIPHVEGVGRCIAPDLIGMGDSSKVGSGPKSYRFLDHRTYIDAFFAVLGIEDAILVGHDWGGALAFDWANRHRNSVAGIAYMETLVAPLTWDDWPEASRTIFRALRSEAGEDLILAKNLFVERILPASVLEPLPEDVMAEYRRPFTEVGEDRRPTLAWPRELPIDGEPKAVSGVVASYARWLQTSPLPKLFINAEPGSILVGRQRRFCRTWANQTEVTVPGIHFIQEDSGELIGRALADWIRTL
jgi:haloalkane dehalogenase